MTLDTAFTASAKSDSPETEFDKVLRSLEEMSNWIKRHQAAREQGPVGIAYGPQGWGVRHTTGGAITPPSGGPRQG